MKPRNLKSEPADPAHVRALRLASEVLDDPKLRSSEEVARAIVFYVASSPRPGGPNPEQVIETLGRQLGQWESLIRQDELIRWTMSGGKV